MTVKLSTLSLIVAIKSQLKLRTTPGVAVYEATMTYDSRVSAITIDLNTVSHVNKFGDTPHCIIDKNYFLATWCVCYDRIGNGAPGTQAADAVKAASATN